MRSVGPQLTDHGAEKAESKLFTNCDDIVISKMRLGCHREGRGQ